MFDAHRVGARREAEQRARSATSEIEGDPAWGVRLRLTAARRGREGRGMGGEAAGQILHQQPHVLGTSGWLTFPAKLGAAAVDSPTRS